jgi:hypothetical protein
MGPGVTVVVPWRGGCIHRERAWVWVLARYTETHPEWTVVLVEAPAGPWVKAAAVMPVVTALDEQAIVIVADADVWCDGLGNAVRNVEDGAAWAIPHQHVYRLDQGATGLVLDGADPAKLGVEHYAERPYIGVAAGGLLVARAGTLTDVPLDPRFVGWGGEDHAWGYALTALHGEPERHDAPLWHLWHPAQPRLDRRHGSNASAALRRRYRAARTDVEAMRQLVVEAQEASPWLSRSSSPTTRGGANW